VLFVPSFFVLAQRFEEWRKRRRAPGGKPLMEKPVLPGHAPP